MNEKNYVVYNWNGPVDVVRTGPGQFRVFGENFKIKFDSRDTYYVFDSYNDVVCCGDVLEGNYRTYSLGLGTYRQSRDIVESASWLIVCIL